MRLLAKMFLDSREHESIPNISFIQPLKRFLATLVTKHQHTQESNNLPNRNLLNPTLNPVFSYQIQHLKDLLLTSNM